MATAAQIEANRLNAQKSTGPTTERGKACAKLNAITHGMPARTIMPVLPQEDPKELEDRTQQAITAMKPRNPLELDLVCHAVRLSWAIDRAERVFRKLRTADFGMGTGEFGMRNGEGEPETVASSQWSVISESGGGEGRGASGDSENGEPERSKPTQDVCPAPEKAPNEAAPSQNRANSGFSA